MRTIVNANYDSYKFIFLRFHIATAVYKETRRIPNFGGVLSAFSFSELAFTLKRNSISRMGFFPIIFFVVVCGVVSPTVLAVYIGSNYGAFVALDIQQVGTEISENQNDLRARTPLSNGDSYEWLQDIDYGMIDFQGELRYWYFDDQEYQIDRQYIQNQFDLCKRTDYQFFELGRRLLRTSWVPNESCPIAKGTYPVKESYHLKAEIPERIINSLYWNFTLYLNDWNGNRILKTEYKVHAVY
ncbi:uncharacterized protein [Venturia canescens]|uniref:uncharacterized protein isoform X1 n=1 Tax=Venturia canescens TaxID=32260 RepID=UPI001C9D4601|nr:uncharacterized protein LOC122417607 isoform X1 [Venturia canescens]